MSVSNAVKQQKIAELIGHQGGRDIIARSMIQPLRSRRDYFAVGRKSLHVEQLPDGALPIYDKDVDVVAYIVSEEGDNIVAVQKPRRVHFPTFEIAANPEIPLSQIRQRRFDVIDRSQDAARSQIQAAEDQRYFATLDSVAVDGYDNVSGAAARDVQVIAPISPSVLAEAFSEIEQNDLQVSRMFFNAKDYSDVRKFGRDILDIESQAVLLKTGLMAQLWGAQIMISRLVPQGFVYIVCEPLYLGRMPVRTELTVISADDPRRRMIGFSVFEEIGIGVYNPAGVTRLVVQRG